MDNDLILVIGIIIGTLAIPSLIGAFSESRPPRAAAILFLIGGTLIAVALTQSAQRYGFGDIPDLFVRVIGRYLN
jgi:hypothetical protein